MVRRCCVVTCRNSRADNCDERVTFFKAPSDQGLFDKWIRSVEEHKSAGSTDIQKSSAICERHFREEDIRREATHRDSFGNVIFQRPLIKFALVKDAIPSIFEEDLEAASIRKKRKRRTVITDCPESANTAQPNSQGNFILSNDGNLNINYGNILVTFNDNQSFNVNNSPSEVIPITVKSSGQNSGSDLENINGTFDHATAFFVDGHVNTYNNGFDIANQIRSDQDSQKNGTEATDHTKIISIYIKPQDDNTSNVNNIENTNTNRIYHSMDITNVNKQQTPEVAEKIPNQCSNFNGSNLEALKEVTIIVPEEELIILNGSNNYGQSNNTQKPANNEAKKNKNPKPAPPEAGTLHYPLPESEAQLNIRAFDIIFYNSHKIKLPSPMWGYHKNSIDKDIIIFSKAKWFKSDVLIPPIYEKQVIFHESDHIKIYINNKFSPLEVRRPKDVQEMELILKHVDETVVCSGGPNIGECDTAQCAQKDYAVNRWRHKLCPIIVGEAETICKFCSTINRVLRYPKKKRLPFGRRAPAPAAPVSDVSEDS